MASHSQKQKQALHSDNMNINVGSDTDSISGEDDVNEVEFEHENCDVETETTENQSKKARKNTSEMWNYFEKPFISSEDGKPRSKCKGCGTMYKAGLGKYGTSSLRRHARTCKQIAALRQKELSEMIIDYQGKVRSRKIDQKVF